MTTQLNQIDFKATYTVDEFEELELPDDDKLYELIEGKLVEKVAPGDEHGWISKNIIKHLILFDPKEKLGSMWPGTSVKLSPKNMPMPDLLFITARRIPKPRSKKPLDLIPDLVVEVHSPRDLASRDRYDKAQIKIRIYQAVGVRIVWAINPRDQKVEVYHPGQLEPVSVLDTNQELDGEDVIPGFRLAVKALFE